MSKKSIIKYIEDDPDDAKLYKNKLELHGYLAIDLVDPRKFPAVTDYDRILLGETKAVIIDQRVEMLSGVPYKGLDVADFLRSLNPMIPIFILTNYEKETEELALGWSVEYIIAKSMLRVKEQIEIHIRRILRAIKRYEDALSENARVFKNLIDKKVSGEMTEREQKQLDRLRSDFQRVFSMKEIKELDRMERDERVKEREVMVLNKILAQLKKLSKTKW